MRRMIVIACAALVARVAWLSAPTQASGANVEETTWAVLWAAPLRVARQNLLLARLRVVEHRCSEAIPPLLTTAEALAFFETQEIGYGGLGAEAGDTRQQVLDCANRIETDNSNALINIDAWLDEIRQWNELRKTVRTTY
jgi:hypothetical protein